MSSAALAKLPDEVTFVLNEVAALLFAIDLAVELTQHGSVDWQTARQAQRIVSSRLWPDLGDLLGPRPQEGE